MNLGWLCLLSYINMMEIIRRKEENFFGNITYSKKSFEMFTGEKMLVPKHIFIQTLFFHIGQKSYSKTEIVFKKNIEKNNVMMMMMYIETNFQFPKSFKKIKKTKQKKLIVDLFFLLQKFCKNLCDDI